MFTAVTDAELSLVCPTDRVPAGTLAREDGWRALRVEGRLDFALVGILARLTGALAAAKIPVFAVSTFDTDYLFLKAGHLDLALPVLASAGFPCTREEQSLRPPSDGGAGSLTGGGDGNRVGT